MQDDDKQQGISLASHQSDDAPDKLYRRQLATVPPFEFSDEVARVFENMAQRSIPGYAAVVELAALLAARFAVPGSVVYDLGCSLGGTTKHLAAALKPKGCRIIAVDQSAAMIRRAEAKLQPEITDGLVTLLNEDIRELSFEPTSVVVSNFTLQFLPLADRNTLLERIARQLEPTGALILAEKISFADADDQELLDDMHIAFRRRHGYTELEIDQKKQALAGVMVTETEERHRLRLSGAGFQYVSKWFQAFNFIGLAARLDSRPDGE